jgi:hypothetical protein
MLEKLITNLKQSLPESLRKKMGTNDEEAEESDENEVQKNENDDSTEEDKKKKSISMLIRVVIILILAYLAVDEFVLSKNKSVAAVDSSLDAQIAKSEAKRKKRKEESKAKELAAAAAVVHDKIADASAIATEVGTGASSSQVPDAPAPTDSSPPIENVNVLDKSDPVATAQPQATNVVEKPEEIVSSKIVDTSVDNKIDKLVEHVDENTPPTAAIEEVKIPSQQDHNISETSPEKTSTPKVETSMASKIVDEATETPAPAYDQVGRGLVYNCKDKYWACVDKPAYVTCNKNMKWNKSKGNAAECVIQSIYSSDEDCAKIQKYNVTIIQPTTFCQ